MAKETKVAKHTPGPWRVIGKGVFRGDGDHTGRIATLHGRMDDREEADVHLIAAAPELLKALRGIVNEVRYLERTASPNCSPSLGAIEEAEAAIRKATGEGEL